MSNTSKQIIAKKGAFADKQRGYTEIIEFLDKSWTNINVDKSLKRMQQLDQELGNPSEKIKTVFVTGSNGKSLTANFVTQLLKDEGLKVGAYYSPHILTYNERISFSNEAISNKSFTEVANEVINAAENLDTQFHASELLTMMSLVFFNQNKVDVAVMEVQQNSNWDPVNICKPTVVAITRVTDKENSSELTESVKEITAIIPKNSWVVSADQNKANLQTMEEETVKAGANWAMPIRKLAILPYPFEQLHGRCAALAERTAQLFIESLLNNDTTIVSNSLLVRPKGTRERPTLEAKRQSELNPRRTVEQFWKENSTTLSSRFQLLDKEKPTILLDNASNLDAIANLLLGIRLLHYQRAVKGLVIIIGCENDELNTPEFLKTIRYFFKKTSGQLIFCPIENNKYASTQTAWDVEKITNDIKSVKVKAKAAKDFADAFDTAKKSVDERNGLVVITGSSSIITEYWNHKGIKKIS